MRHPIAFIGYSNSGKTTLLVGLIRHLSRDGERVAVIKHTHHDPSARKKRGDTELFLEAGASIVVLAGRNEAAILEPNGHDEQRHFESAGEIPTWIEADRILVEGYKSLELWPRILVERSEAELIRPVPPVVAIVTDSDETFDVPVFRHHELEELAGFIDRIPAG